MVKIEIEECEPNIRNPCNECGAKLKGRRFRMLLSMGGGMRGKTVALCMDCGSKAVRAMEESLQKTRAFVHRLATDPKRDLPWDMQAKPLILAALPNAKGLRPKPKNPDGA